MKMDMMAIYIVFFVDESVRGLINYIYYKKKIETVAIDAINRAEDTDLKGHEKLQHAVKDVSAMIPAVLRPFINDAVIETVIQTIFDKIEEYCAKQTPDNEDSEESSKDEDITE